MSNNGTHINEYYQTYLTYTAAHDKFANKIGLHVTEVDLGYARGELEIQSYFNNPMNIVHGGILFTIVDTLGGVATTTYGHPLPTIDASIQFFRSFDNSTKIIGEAHVIKNGRNIKVVDVTLYDDSHKICVKSTLQYFDLNPNR